MTEVRKHSAFLPLTTTECLHFFPEQIFLTQLLFFPLSIRFDVCARERCHSRENVGDLNQRFDFRFGRNDLHDPEILLKAQTSRQCCGFVRATSRARAI
jgi:hypothetical protein